MTARKGASRREILKVAGAGGVGLGLAPFVIGGDAPSAAWPVREAAVAQPRTATVATGKPAVAAPREDSRGYLAELVGKRLGTYRVESVGALDRGGIPVEMKTAGGVRFRVDVLRFDPSEGAKGIGALSSVTVYLCNGGRGRKATDEKLGLGAMALADELARREREGARPPRGLLTMGQRAARDASPPASIDASVT
jgi:hypothetical protein